MILANKRQVFDDPRSSFQVAAEALTNTLGCSFPHSPGHHNESLGKLNSISVAKHIAVVIEVVGLAMSIGVGSSMGMIILSGMEEWLESLECGPA